MTSAHIYPIAPKPQTLGHHPPTTQKTHPPTYCLTACTAGTSVKIHPPKRPTLKYRATQRTPLMTYNHLAPLSPRRL
jgi:hypothetical protein